LFYFDDVQGHFFAHYLSENYLKQKKIYRVINDVFSCLMWEANKEERTHAVQ